MLGGTRISANVRDVNRFSSHDSRIDRCLLRGAEGGMQERSALWSPHTGRGDSRRLAPRTRSVALIVSCHRPPGMVSPMDWDGDIELNRN